MSSRRRFPLTTYNQINLTNLIDLLFFLLVIFMIETMLIKYSREVTPPEMNADPVIPENESQIINIKADGTIIYEQRTVTEAELTIALSHLEQLFGRETEIYLRGDKNLRYGTVMNVMRLAKNAGFKSINLMTSPEDITRGLSDSK